jgi:hypothetical protein
VPVESRFLDKAVQASLYLWLYSNTRCCECEGLYQHTLWRANRWTLKMGAWLSTLNMGGWLPTTSKISRPMHRRPAPSTYRVVELKSGQLVSPLINPNNVSAADLCGEKAHDAMLALARNWSSWLMANETLGMTTHGLFGIFASGAEHKSGKYRGKRSSLNYRDVKTAFMFRRVCERARTGRVATICEVGFNAGLSAMLLLAAAPHARVVSFDLGDFPWAEVAAVELVRRSAGRLTVVFGKSDHTIPRYVRSHPGFACDVGFVDGSKSYVHRRSDVLNLATLATRWADVPLFLDEVTAQQCINGSYAASTWKDRCSRRRPAFEGAMRAYNELALEGVLGVRECAWPRMLQDTDGICLAKIRRARAASLLH